MKVSGLPKSITGIFVALAVVFIGGCAHRHHHRHAGDIIIDTQGVDQYQYQSDLYDCPQYAEQVPVGGRTAKSSVGGAVVGGALGAIVGNSDTAAKGAGVGAVTGAVKRAGSGYREKQRVVKNCLRGRGYRVLN